MRKQFLLTLLTGVFAAGMLAGCGKEEAEPTVLSAPVETEISVEKEPEEEPVAVPEEPTVPEGMARSYLTGEWIDEELASKRPLAVMLGNSKAALPQYGISEADVIYEATVEGSETRLMAIFQDYEHVDKIMSVRSCRRYYLDWMLEFDAIYAHYGAAHYANATLESDLVDNLNGITGIGDVVYARDSCRRSPHNAYATGASVLEGIARMQYDTQLSEDYTGHYRFNEDDTQEITLEGGADALYVVPGYWVNKPWFVYDSETGLYSRFEYDAPQVDGANDVQVAVKNIIIQNTGWYDLNDNGYLEMYTTAGGTGYYITNGRAIPISWSKSSQTEPTRYYDENGNEITLNQGKTWVCITQDTYADRIAFYDSAEAFDANGVN